MVNDFAIGNVDTTIQLVVGYAALTLSLIYRIPQWIKLYKYQRGDDISTAMLLIQNLSYLLYIAYGIMQADLVYIISSAVSFVQGVIIHLMVYYYDEKKKRLVQDSAKDNPPKELHAIMVVPVAAQSSHLTKRGGNSDEISSVLAVMPTIAEIHQPKAVMELPLW
jgi:uncharacterized protein with PQ loop repeat